MSDELLLLTNNPLVMEKHGGLETKAVEKIGLAAVLEAALELTQAGYKLISTPLPPNVPLIRGPYRSLLLRCHPRRYDAQGLVALEKAGRAAAKLGTAFYEERAALDVAFIDREILFRTFRECGYEIPESLAARRRTPALLAPSAAQGESLAISCKSSKL